MIRQIVNGKVAKTVNVTASEADMTTLKGLMAGELETWDSKATGGTPANPAVLNYVGFSVGKKDVTGVVHSTGIFIPHIKPTKKMADIRTAVVGVWNADFQTTSACEYANPYNLRSEV